MYTYGIYRYFPSLFFLSRDRRLLFPVVFSLFPTILRALQYVSFTTKIVTVITTSANKFFKSEKYNLIFSKFYCIKFKSIAIKRRGKETTRIENMNLVIILSFSFVRNMLEFKKARNSACISGEIKILVLPLLIT